MPPWVVSPQPDARLPQEFTQYFASCQKDAVNGSMRCVQPPMHVLVDNMTLVYDSGAGTYERAYATVALKMQVVPPGTEHHTML